ncbi:hypothetical protein J6E39_06530 [bacterium]|nr:hypothetical protein [bacterium]
MKKLLSLILVLFGLFLSPLKSFAIDVIPRYVNLNPTRTIGFYQVSNGITLHKEADEKSPVVHSFTWSKDKIFPENTKFEDLFILYISQRDLALMNVVDETEDWVQVIYNNSTGSKGWIKKDDPYRFMSWINFMNMYGKKYGLYELQGAPNYINDIKSAPADNAQSLGTLNHPEKINLNVIRGNFALVNVYDLDRTPKTGFIRWRSDEGVIYFFPDIKYSK